MSFLRVPTRGPEPYQAEGKISAAPAEVAKIPRDVHPARVPRGAAWHPASQRHRSLEAQAAEVEEATVVQQEQAPSRVPEDLAALIAEKTGMGREVGSDTVLATDRFGKHKAVAGDGEPLHPGLKEVNPAVLDPDAVHARTRVVREISGKIGARIPKVDFNGFPIPQQQPSPEDPAEPASEKSKARRIADALDEITQLHKSDPDLVEQVMDYERNR